MIKRFVQNGSISAADVTAVDKLYADQPDPPMWQGRVPAPNENRIAIGQRTAIFRLDLWRFSVAHAMQGVVDFLTAAAAPAQRLGIPTGAVFFPEANQNVGQGFDSRLQPWDRFPASLEWNPNGLWCVWQHDLYCQSGATGAGSSALSNTGKASFSRNLAAVD